MKENFLMKKEHNKVSRPRMLILVKVLAIFININVNSQKKKNTLKLLYHKIQYRHKTLNKVITKTREGNIHKKKN